MVETQSTDLHLNDPLVGTSTPAMANKISKRGVVKTPKKETKPLSPRRKPKRPRRPGRSLSIM
jgi:hypothetical protein